MRRTRVSISSADRPFGDDLRRILAVDSSLGILDEDDRTPAAADVLLLDSRTSGAVESCARVSTKRGPRVILVAAPENEAWAVDALAAGARGVVPRRASAVDLLQAVRTVGAGDVWAPRHVLVAALLKNAGLSGGKGDAPLAAVRLTGRERQVFRYAAAGLPNRELAERLSISEATVKAHLTHIFQKLGVRGRAKLAAAYHRVPAPAPERASVRRARRPA